VPESLANLAPRVPRSQDSIAAQERAKVSPLTQSSDGRGRAFDWGIVDPQVFNIEVCGATKMLNETV
jgi:hypothetical protein